jgi:phosphatidylserine/phosphatidylglycerophosphate/cardiolipin synthase-like enzyme
VRFDEPAIPLKHLDGILVGCVSAFSSSAREMSCLVSFGLPKRAIPEQRAHPGLFSPAHGCTDAIVKEISDAKTEILVLAYSCTSAPIAEALVAAHQRGVKVEAILDNSRRSEKYTSGSFLANSGIPTFIDARHAIAHTRS